MNQCFPGQTAMICRSQGYFIDMLLRYVDGDDIFSQCNDTRRAANWEDIGHAR